MKVDTSAYRIIDNGYEKGLFILTEIKGIEYLISLNDGSSITEEQLFEFGWSISTFYNQARSIRDLLEVIADNIYKQDYNETYNLEEEEDVPF